MYNSPNSGPTFYDHRGVSFWLDITVGSQGFPVCNWAIRPELGSLSDHEAISFGIQLPKCDTRLLKRRNWWKAEWGPIREQLPGLPGAVCHLHTPIKCSEDLNIFVANSTAACRAAYFPNVPFKLLKPNFSQLVLPHIGQCWKVRPDIKINLYMRFHRAISQRERAFCQ